MSPSDSIERSENPSEVKTPPLTAFRRRRFLKGMALGSLLALGGGSVLVFWGRHTLPQYIPFESMGEAAGRITALAWSPDGKYIASATGVMQTDRYDVDPSTSTTLQIWEASHGKLVRTYPYSPYGTLYPPLAWSADSQRLTWWDGNQQYLRLYEVAVEGPSAHPTERTLFQQPNVTAGQPVVAFSPDGKWLASGGEYSEQISVYRIATNGAPVWSYGQFDESQFAKRESSVTALAWSPDSRRLVAGRSNSSTGIIKSQILIMDLTSGKPLLQTPATTLETISSLAWSPDGGLLAVGYAQDRDNGRGYVRIFNPSTGHQVTSYQHTDTNWIGTICWSPRSSRLLALITNNGSAVQIWDLHTSDVIAVYHHGINVNINTLAWSPDGKSLVTGGEDKRLCIWPVP